MSKKRHKSRAWAREARIPKAALDACYVHAGVVGYETLNPGQFDTEIEAALAYDRAAIVLKGNQARPNFVWITLPNCTYRVVIKASGEPVENTERRTLAEMETSRGPYGLRTGTFRNSMRD